MGILMRNRKSYTGKVKFTDYQNIGKIDAFMRTTAPEGYLKCDGSTYNIADYPLLCDVFASDFGSVNYFGGDGTTTFKVPDLRGEFLRGTGTNSHTNQGSGANVGTHQDATRHPRMSTGNSLTDFRIGGAKPATSFASISENEDNMSSGSNVNYVAKMSPTATNDNPYTGYTSRPTNTSVLYCIRAY